ncbi:U32 family peptidase [Proteiniclasticum sp.]|uniref:peptidase U32 family protein n=1 Tax=Proteiniclasticum sp. TaxID=2053595 RepID=UPI00289E481A|nr:U32 family peptidase [Proteiniclasticum sp.]
MNKPELLAPAGNLNKLKTAIDYGADAVFMGGARLNLRAFSDNFTNDEMVEGLKYAHDRGRKVYVTINVFPHESDMKGLDGYLLELEKLGVDALIVSDPGIIMTAKEVVPEMELHLSTQANNVNSRSAIFWHKMGVKRIILARELSLKEIREIHGNIPEDLELEAFVHGSMCMAYSGRCLLSNYMTGRDANRGACAQPCRYKYHLVEEKRPGEYMEINEDERGTYIMNSKDLCMIEHIPDLIQSGLQSLKIEGRMKSEFYVAAIVKAYREAIDRYFENPKTYAYDEKWMDILSMVSHREYFTGFYYGRGNSEVYGSSTYVRTHELIAIVKEELEDGRYLIGQKNRVYPGDILKIMRPSGDIIETEITAFMDDEGNEIEVANKAAMDFTAVSSVRLYPNDILIKEKED